MTSIYKIENALIDLVPAEWHGCSSSLDLLRQSSSCRGRYKLSNVEKDEVLGFVSDKGPEVASHDAVPSRPILLIEVDLDVLANVLFLLVPSIAAAATFSASFFISPCTP